MQIETLKVFCDVVEHNSFSKAATINDITQSAVSQQIRSMEERYGITLIERNRRRFSLTPEGDTFLQAAREMLDIYDSLGDRLQELKNVIGGEIKIASIYSIGLHELPPYIKSFRAAYPEVNINVEYKRSNQVYNAVLNGEVDFGFVSYPVRRNGLHFEPFISDRLIVICHPSHRFAGLSSIRLEDLNDENFIAFEPDLPTRKIIDRHLREHGVSVRQTMEFDNIETVKRAVEIESGVSIVPENTVSTEVSKGILCAIPIVEPELWRPLGILHKRSRAHSPAQKQFLLSVAAKAHGVGVENEELDGFQMEEAAVDNRSSEAPIA
jgi:DNA-binding transcriptional LysR family regulator